MMPAESRENPLMKKGNSDAFFEEKHLTKNRNHPGVATHPDQSAAGAGSRWADSAHRICRGTPAGGIQHYRKRPLFGENSRPDV